MGCSASDDASTDPTPTVTARTTPEASPATTDVEAEPADDSVAGKPGSTAELATMLQAQSESAGQNEMTIGDVTVNQTYTADGDTLIITTTYGEGFEVPADKAALTSAIDQMISPLGDQLLPMAQQVTAGARETLDVAVVDGTNIYTKTFE